MPEEGPEEDAGGAIQGAGPHHARSRTLRYPLLYWAAAEAVGWLEVREAVPALLRCVREGRLLAMAAGSLCLLGERHGAPPILEEGARALGGCFPLNALRDPATWRRLRTGRLTPGASVPQPEIFAGIERATGLRADPEKLRDGELPVHHRSAARVLAFYGAGLEPILEGGRIRLLPREDALELWKEWWEDGGAPIDDEQGRRVR